MSALRWQWHYFEGMPPQVLHCMLQLREAVFIVEQDCVYADIDGFDPQAQHLTGHAGTDLVACLRVLPPGTRAPLPSIGRICTAQAVRGTGVGRELFRRGVAHVQQQWPDQAVFISAQRYLERFYTDFGFEIDGEPYDEDGIAHINMILQLSA